jgi:hypothetical protein
MKLNRFFPFALVYFFFNSVGLPFGLTWMALCAPLFYVWILRTRKTEILLPFIALLLPFMVAHLLSGVNLPVYLVSMLNLILVYVFCQAFYTYLKTTADPERLFTSLLVLNFAGCLAGMIFYFTPYTGVFWIQQELTVGVKDFWRFRMFTYEASYYGTLFIPLFFFFFLQYVLRQNRIRGGLLLIMIFLPLILSFSMGVIAAACISLFCTVMIHARSLLPRRRVVNLIINVGFVFTGSAMVLIFYFRNNPLFTRLLNIFSGSDLSAKGRTVDSFRFAKEMIAEKSDWFGIGIGQVKILGHDLIQGFYLYNMDFVATIPNGMAEMLAVFGWLGLILKLFIECYLFLVTKVWANYYRLLLFFYMFIYQFTGSFVTNLAEYVIWILAFTNVFVQFNVKRKGIGSDGEPIIATQAY